MRITVDLDEKDIARIKKTSGIKKVSPAIRYACQEYLRQLEKKQFLSSVLDGKSDYSMTNDKLEAMGTYDTD